MKLSNELHKMAVRLPALLRCRHLITVMVTLTAFPLEPVQAAVKTWTGLAGDGLWSTAGNWILAGSPGPSDNVTFTNLAFADGPLAEGGVVNNTVSAATTVNSLGYFNISGSHNTMLGEPLTVQSVSRTDVAFLADDGQPSVLFTGSGQADLAGDIVYATIAGTALSVINTNAVISVTQASATSGGHRATLDLSTLNSFTCNVSNILVGHDFGVPITRPTGTLILAVSNNITTELISVGDAYQNAGAISYIHLGEQTTLNVARIRVALHKCIGTIDISPGLVGGTVKIRGQSGSGRSVSWEIGDEYEPNTALGYFTSSQSTGIFDLTGARVDAMVDKIVLGRGQIDAPTRTGDGNGTLTFGGGTINANRVEMGIQLSGGGSAGRGILNLNNDDGLSPATLVVNSNLVLAVQLPGNTDNPGSTATININGGVLAVSGDVTDGDGTSTITLNNGGRIDLKPAGDSTAGNFAVDNLNIDDGSITNYGTLSATTIALSGATTQFTVYSGQTISPGGDGRTGVLALGGGDMVLRGTLAMDINKTGSILSADKLTASGNLDLGGTLRVRFSGTGTLAAGDKFGLVTGGTVTHSFATLEIPAPGAGLGWKNNLSTDGSIEVVLSTEPATPPAIAINTSVSGSLVLSWPVTYTSFALRGQTNSTGISNNWGLVQGVVGNQITIPFNQANRAVFFQLFQR